MQINGVERVGGELGDGAGNGLVRLSIFSLLGIDFSNGSQFHDGVPVWPFPQKPDKELIHITSGLCGIYTVFNLLASFGMNPDLDKLESQALQLGVNSDKGTNHLQLESLLKFYQLEILRLKINKMVDVKTYLNAKYLLAVNIYQMSVDEVVDSRQRGDGHWVVLYSVDEMTSLIADSSIRPDGLTYGTTTVTNIAMERILADFDCGCQSYICPHDYRKLFLYGETAVNNEAHWYLGKMFAVKPLK